MDEVIEHSTTEIFADGIHEVKIVQGVARIALFSKSDGDRAITGRLAVPVTGLPDMIQLLAKALAEAGR